MTQCPGAPLARGLDVRYSALALVTDDDSGLDGRPDAGAATQADVFVAVADDSDRVRSVSRSVLAGVPAEGACGCAATGFG
jgi:5'-methylthioadenosine phosphorylase